MRTDVRIECVVLDGVRLSHRERAELGPAIARELRRLAGEPAAARPAPPIQPGNLEAGAIVHGIAREVAAAVHLATAAARPPVVPAGPAVHTARRRGRP